MVTATHEWGAIRRRNGARLAALVLAAGAVSLGLPADAVAQAKKAAEAAGAAEPPRIQRAYAAGVRAFESGDMAETDRQLSIALSGGGLPNAQMAKALYLRGTAYRQLGRPAQAISDLTTAVWLKGGLSETDKAKATQERQLAYREAGLGDSPPPIGAAPLDQSATTKTAASPAPTPGTQVVNVGKGGFWNSVSLPSLPSLPSLSFGSSQTQTAAAPVEAAAATPAAAAAPAQGFAPGAEGAPAAAASGFGAVTVAASDEAAGRQASVEQVAAVQPSTWDTQTSADSAASNAQPVPASYAPPQETAGLAAVPGASPAAPQASGSGWSNPLAGSGTAISGFFGNIFGGGTGAQTASADATAVTTGSTSQPGWGPDTTVATPQTSSMVQRGPESPPAAAPVAARMAAPMAAAPMAAPMATPAAAAQTPAEAPAALPWAAAGQAPASQAAPQQAATRMASTGAAGGRYKLQVASVRSREEAERLAETLRGYQPVRDGTVAPEVDEAVIGSMGTFYRVRLGPYANASEPGQLCKTLKPQGFDCLVVTQ